MQYQHVIALQHISGYRQVWLFVLAAFAHELQRAWMVPGKLRRCFFEQVCQGVKCKGF